jgi:hypothetical protein
MRTSPTKAVTATMTTAMLIMRMSTMSIRTVMVNDIDVDGRGNNDMDATELSATLRQTQEILELLERRQQADMQDQPPPSSSVSLSTTTSSAISRRKRANRSNEENEPPVRQLVNADVRTAANMSSPLASNNVRRSARLSH